VSKSSCRPHLAQAGLCLGVFFACMGALNLYVAFNFSREIWLSFKLFGSLGLMLVFVMAQSLFLSKYIEEKK
jgi:intracellular septation protein